VPRDYELADLELVGFGILQLVGTDRGLTELSLAQRVRAVCKALYMVDRVA
jgi:uncharacterized protein YheU (UPF0270 family)